LFVGTFLSSRGGIPAPVPAFHEGSRTPFGSFQKSLREFLKDSACRLAAANKAGRQSTTRKLLETCAKRPDVQLLADRVAAGSLQAGGSTAPEERPGHFGARVRALPRISTSPIRRYPELLIPPLDQGPWLRPEAGTNPQLGPTSAAAIAPQTSARADEADAARVPSWAPSCYYMRGPAVGRGSSRVRFFRGEPVGIFVGRSTIFYVEGLGQISEAGAGITFSISTPPDTSWSAIARAQAISASPTGERERSRRGRTWRRAASISCSPEDSGGRPRATSRHCARPLFERLGSGGMKTDPAAGCSDSTRCSSRLRGRCVPRSSSFHLDEKPQGRPPPKDLALAAERAGRSPGWMAAFRTKAPRRAFLRRGGRQPGNGPPSVFRPSPRAKSLERPPRLAEGARPPHSRPRTAVQPIPGKTTSGPAFGSRTAAGRAQAVNRAQGPRGGAIGCHGYPRSASGRRPKTIPY